MGLAAAETAPGAGAPPGAPRDRQGGRGLLLQATAEPQPTGGRFLLRRQGWFGRFGRRLRRISRCGRSRSGGGGSATLWNNVRGRRRCRTGSRSFSDVVRLVLLDERQVRPHRFPNPNDNLRHGLGDQLVNQLDGRRQALGPGLAPKLRRGRLQPVAHRSGQVCQKTFHKVHNNGSVRHPKRRRHVLQHPHRIAPVATRKRPDQPVQHVTVRPSIRRCRFRPILAIRIGIRSCDGS